MPNFPFFLRRVTCSVRYESRGHRVRAFVSWKGSRMILLAQNKRGLFVDTRRMIRLHGRRKALELILEDFQWADIGADLKSRRKRAWTRKCKRDGLDRVFMLRGSWK